MLLIPPVFLYNILYITCILVWAMFIVNGFSNYLKAKRIKKIREETEKIDSEINKLMRSFIESIEKDSVHDCYDCLPDNAKAYSDKKVAKKKVVRENK